MAKNKSLISKWLLLRAIVTKAIDVCESRGMTLSFSDVENVVREVAAGYGVTGDLLAILLRDLSRLLWDTPFADLEASEAQISLSSKPQYEKWTGGRHDIVGDIRKYETKKHTFSFWINITNRECASLGKPKECLMPTARKLLLLLAEHIGTSVSCREVFEHITGRRPETHKGWKRLLNVYLTQLQNFAEDDFRKSYLVADRVTDTWSLRESFRNKYFVFLILKGPQN